MIKYFPKNKIILDLEFRAWTISEKYISKYKVNKKLFKLYKKYSLKQECHTH